MRDLKKRNSPIIKHYQINHNSKENVILRLVNYPIKILQAIKLGINFGMNLKTIFLYLCNL
jgi:hypothetical protein